MILVLFLGILIILFMYIFGIPCFFYKVTSFYCPGCGFTRAVFALLHFDIYQVLRYNLLIVIYIPLILYCLFLNLFKKGVSYTKFYFVRNSNFSLFIWSIAKYSMFWLFGSYCYYNNLKRENGSIYRFLFFKSIYQLCILFPVFH